MQPADQAAFGVPMQASKPRSCESHDPWLHRDKAVSFGTRACALT
ncbi:hypothetical protein GLE_3251 [Lysobacter enzymogenes]|uniref:Uncharacterized protein n=1 Tax=Lysobacter enzymogenes TaxID=69 RepID=A0A0S2DIY3_LYSEN|nr:hypothetical protein GLE_3251 [Lysobacter enzymogenes]